MEQLHSIGGNQLFNPMASNYKEESSKGFKPYQTKGMSDSLSRSMERVNASQISKDQNLKVIMGKRNQIDGRNNSQININTSNALAGSPGKVRTNSVTHKIKMQNYVPPGGAAAVMHTNQSL